jgi:hypothetical protein
MPGARAFVGAWAIWLGGYGALLALDRALRRLGVADGASALQVMVAVTVLAGAAAGFFLAAAARWTLRRRLLLLLLQAPAAYMAAVSLGIGYLCVTGVHCP